MNLSKLILLLSVIVVTFSCSSSNNNADVISAYSNLTISNSSVASENNTYNSHPTGSSTISVCTWNVSGKYFIVNGYVVNNNVVEKIANVRVYFQSKPTVSGVYTIGSINGLSSSQCNIEISTILTDYKTVTLSQPVNVTVNNGVVSIDISNLTFTNNGSTSAIITGSIIEGR